MQHLDEAPVITPGPPASIDMTAAPAPSSQSIVPAVLQQASAQTSAHLDRSRSTSELIRVAMLNRATLSPSASQNPFASSAYAVFRGSRRGHHLHHRMNDLPQPVPDSRPLPAAPPPRDPIFTRHIHAYVRCTMYDLRSIVHRPSQHRTSLQPDIPQLTTAAAVTGPGASHTSRSKLPLCTVPRRLLLTATTMSSRPPQPPRPSNSYSAANATSTVIASMC
jgi:hypothetical protein